MSPGEYQAFDLGTSIAFSGAAVLAGRRAGNRGLWIVRACWRDSPVRPRLPGLATSGVKRNAPHHVCSTRDCSTSLGLGDYLVACEAEDILLGAMGGKCFRVCGGIHSNHHSRHGRSRLRTDVASVSGVGDTPALLQPNQRLLLTAPSAWTIDCGTFTPAPQQKRGALGGARRLIRSGMAHRRRRSSRPSRTGCPGTRRLHLRGQLPSAHRRLLASAASLRRIAVTASLHPERGSARHSTAPAAVGGLAGAGAAWRLRHSSTVGRCHGSQRMPRYALGRAPSHRRMTASPAAHGRRDCQRFASDASPLQLDATELQTRRPGWAARNRSSQSPMSASWQFGCIGARRSAAFRHAPRVGAA